MDIQVEDIEYRIPETTKPLFKVSRWNLNSGDHVLIRGPSGSGKSSFLNLLGALAQPTSGRVFFDKKDLSLLADHEKSDLRRNEIGFIFQRLNLLPHLSVLENILLGLGDGQGVKNAGDAVESFSLKNLSGRRCGVLSLGEQQRVAIARTFAKNPKLILADEPTSSLDHATTEKVMEELIARSKGKSLVCVSHDDRVEKYFHNKIDFGKWQQR